MMKYPRRLRRKAWAIFSSAIFIKREPTLNFMLAAKVLFRHAEEAKNHLLGKGVFLEGYRLKKGSKYIYFPVKEKVDGKNITFVEETFERHRKETIQDYLPKEIQNKIPASYDIVGDIILIDIPEDLRAYESEIGRGILKTHKKAKTVLKRDSQHSGEFRTQEYRCIAGIDKRETIYRENNIMLKLDVEKVYFSSRLSTERKRIFEQVRPKERVLVMFSGCGPYVCAIAKNTKAAKVIGIEKNPVAHGYAVENMKINKLSNVEFHCGDVREKVPGLGGRFDRIVMPLPKEADTFLDTAFKAAKKGTRIHLYDFEHEDEIDKARAKVDAACKRNEIDYAILDMVKCGQYSPGKFRICVDFEIR